MNIDSYKEDIKRYNRILNGYVDIFKRKYNTSINVNISFNEKMIDLNMIGIGADEFHQLRRVKQPVGTHCLQINNHIELKFTDEVSYEYFEEILIKRLLFLNKAIRTCHLKRKY